VTKLGRSGHEVRKYCQETRAEARNKLALPEAADANRHLSSHDDSVLCIAEPSSYPAHAALSNAPPY